MLQEGNQWVYEIDVWSWVHFAYIDTTIETITIGTDTFINGLEYSKVITSRVPACLNASSTEYLRENGNEIYHWHAGLQQELLMIDFDETIGYELIYNGYDDIDTGMVIIDSFGIEVVADGTPLEVQYMRIINNQSYDDYTIFKVYKNIGFIEPGLLFPDVGTGLCDAGNGLHFRCHISGQDTIHFTNFDCFELPVINGTIDPSVGLCSINPNPAMEYFFIPEGLKFKDLVNFNGQVMKVEVDMDKIQLSELSSGYYIARFHSADGGALYIGRIVKI